MKKRIKVALIFGGKSVEHDVSLMSVRNVADVIDKKKYSIIYIKIDKEGKWFRCDSNLKLKGKEFSPFSLRVDVVFPILHGSYGEDGTVQGLFKLIGIPFVGPSVLGSAIGFDKDITKRLLTKAGIPNTKFITLRKKDDISFNKFKKILKLPMIIKPVNAGSSIGINKVENKKEFDSAVKYAFKFDRKIIIEEFIIDKRELECAVLGNGKPQVSICGEVITNKKYKFYSYKAKYFDETGAILEVPARIPKSLEKKIQKLSIKTFEVLELEGMSRIDFFLKKNGQLVINEVNTIPGFTNISMYPTLWRKSGISYSKLIDKLIDLAIERYKKEQKLKTFV